MTNHLPNRIFGNAFNLIPQLGATSLTRLLKYFGEFESAWFAEISVYKQAGLPDKLIRAIREKRPQINPEKSFAELTRRGIEVITISEPAFPPLLKEIVNAPPVLYVRGDSKALSHPGIGVVGTRKMTGYGKQACEEIVTGLVQNNLSVISGLAFGVDAVSLTATIAEGGIAVAVLASDLDNNNISPRANFHLAQKIIDHGCLVSEFPLGYVVIKQNFPIRNRIIAGLSLGTLVVEADLESGSLITANFALEQNREVFAIPGSIFSQTSRGTNALIKKGAKLVARVSDILEEFDLEAGNPEPINFSATAQEQLLLDLLSAEPRHVDELIKSVNLTASQINANLTMLEMKGRIKNLGGGKYAKIR